MRIDKFLWCVRYFKTRTIATESCRKGHVRVNGEIAKPSREIFVGDRVVIRKNQINYECKVLDMPLSRVGAKLVDLYRQDLTPQEVFEHAEMIKLTQEYYRKKGEGRPTKKDRRAIDNLLTDFDDDWDSE